MTREQRHDLYTAVFTTTEGRKVLRDICEHCRVDGALFHPDNDRQTAFALGRRGAALWIREQLKQPEEKPNGRRNTR